MPGIIDDPGDAVNCGDFATWTEANIWFWKYREAGYQDGEANLDSNDDGIPCEGLPEHAKGADTSRSGAGDVPPEAGRSPPPLAVGTAR